MSEEHKGLPVLPFARPAALSAWLKKNHATSPGMWIKFAKKGSGIATVTYEEARDLALTWGWIDGQIARWDAPFFLRRFTRRGPRSKWSAINRDIATELMRTGAMEAPGQAEVDRARDDGRWDDAYASPSKIEPHKDLQAALDKNPRAQKALDALPKAERYAVLYRVHDAKRDDTRQRRIDIFIERLLTGTDVAAPFGAATKKKAPAKKR